jgi:hypothetical protein
MAANEVAGQNSRAPVIRIVYVPSGGDGRGRWLLMAWVASAVVHAVLFAAFLGTQKAYANRALEAKPAEREAITETKVEEDKPAEKEFNLENDELGISPDLKTNYDLPRIDTVSVPGQVDPTAPVGIKNAPDGPKVTIPPPPGVGGSKGQGGGLESAIAGKASPFGTPGGFPGGKYMAGGFGGRSGATREQMLTEGGGNGESEAAVARGLKWIVQHQAPDGHWALDRFNEHGRCNCTGFGAKYDVAATAFGLLPLLGAGENHLATGKNHAYAKVVQKGLSWLISRQKGDGSFSGNMYEQGLATIAICEAYGLTSDPKLKVPAQKALNFVCDAQSQAGGWRYGAKQPGFDTSVSGWQLMGLKSGQMASLSVPKENLHRADQWMNAAMDRATYGYGYTSAGAGTTTSAVGLLCREYRGWGPRTTELAGGIQNLLYQGGKRTTPTTVNWPGGQGNMYYYYYMTQVLHHFGGPDWKLWNEAKDDKGNSIGRPGMRDWLISKQDRGQDPKHPHQIGSWSPAGDAHGAAGGRVMITSMSLLTLEVYYRYLPLYRREQMGSKDETVRSGL